MPGFLFEIFFLSTFVVGISQTVCADIDGTRNWVWGVVFFVFPWHEFRGNRGNKLVLRKNYDFFTRKT